jgi:hypothetical protein
MRTTIAIAAALVLATASYSTGFAKSGSNSGASQGSPGHQYQTNGAVSGTHGASGYAPGQQYRTNGAVSGTHGAAGYAPGHTK